MSWKFGHIRHVLAAIGCALECVVFLELFWLLTATNLIFVFYRSDLL